MSRKLQSNMPTPDDGFYVVGTYPIGVDRLEEYETDETEMETVEVEREIVLRDRWNKEIKDKSGKKKTRLVTETLTRAKKDSGGKPVTKRVTKTRGRRYNLPVGTKIPEAWDIKPRKRSRMAEKGKIVFVRHEVGADFLNKLLNSLSRDTLYRLAITELGAEKGKKLGLHPVKTKKDELMRALVSERVDVPDIAPEPPQERDMTPQELAELDAKRAAEREAAELRKAEETARAAEKAAAEKSEEKAETPRSQLEAMSENHLRGVAKQNKIDHAGLSSKEIVDAILVATGYEDPTS